MPRILSNRSAGSVVDAALFKTQFDAFTASLFAGWDAEMWANVLVAGGAVLASLLPVPDAFASLRPSRAHALYDLSGFQRMRVARDAADEAMLGTRGGRDEFLRGTRWPESDVDIFVYGVDEAAAQRKLHAICRSLRRVVKSRLGVACDVSFVRTENTITMARCTPFRAVQVITRIYQSAEHVLNGFDIDCCCFGFDGVKVLATPRAVCAVATRTNTINLSIRGAAYEYRLLKYAERGFGVGVPGLEAERLDREHLAIEMHADKYCVRPDNESSRKWQEAEGLERLLLADRWARAAGGVLLRSDFPNRERRFRETNVEADAMHFRLLPNGVGDFYSLASAKTAAKHGWPAFTNVDWLAAPGDTRGANKPFWLHVKWAVGNIERQPQTLEEWTRRAYRGFGHKRDTVTDWKQWAKEREARERAEKEQAEAKRQRELDEARREAAAAAELERDRAAAEACAAKEAAGQRAAELARVEAARRRELVRKQQVEAEVAALSAANRELADAADGTLCIVCLEAPKQILLEPCHHMALCGECAAQVDTCPVCRAPKTGAQRVFTC